MIKIWNSLKHSMSSLGAPPILMYASSSEVKAFQFTLDHQFDFITGESRIQSIDYDVNKGNTFVHTLV